MEDTVSPSILRRQVVDSYWETFPPLWRMIQAHIRQVAVEQYEITVEQFHALRHIHRGYDSVSKLAKVKDISRPAVSKAVDLLVHRGLIVRTTDLQDRRHVKLDLTEKGNNLLDAIYDETRRWMIKLLETLDSREMRALIFSMDSLRKIL
jgi:DNA-binding MarR family transcriptional regulator